MDSLTRTMEIFDSYERRFAEAALSRPKQFSPYHDRRKEIKAAAMRMLAIREEMLPTIGDFTTVSHVAFGSYDVSSVRYETFPRCYGAADIYTPHGTGPFPVAFLFPGHSEGGRKAPAYRTICRRLAACGFMVVAPDNMGQGDRLDMGHKRAYAVLSSGITLQGMIVLEAWALIRRFTSYPKADPARLCALGNSGGGTLCLLLAAVSEELAALVASGYPSDFGYILSKERRHCACNLLPGCAHGPEMWEILSTFAPRPLMILQGTGDHLIPLDYFYRTARKVDYVYEALGEKNAFEAITVESGHVWKNVHISAIVDFLCRRTGLTVVPDPEGHRFDGAAALPADFANVFEVAAQLTGRPVDPQTPLEAIYPPTYDGVPIRPDEIVPDLGRGEVMQVWAQMECALTQR